MTTHLANSNGNRAECGARNVGTDRMRSMERRSEVTCSRCRATSRFGGASHV